MTQLGGAPFEPHRTLSSAALTDFSLRAMCLRRAPCLLWRAYYGCTVAKYGCTVAYGALRRPVSRQARLAFELLARLAYDGDMAAGSRLADELLIAVRKQLTSAGAKYRCLGMLGGCCLLGRLGARRTASQSIDERGGAAARAAARTAAGSSRAGAAGSSSQAEMEPQEGDGDGDGDARMAVPMESGRQQEADELF